ncbi:MAG: restriction endonuclease [Planctomycetota bacterium]|jgi:restriction system protein
MSVWLVRAGKNGEREDFALEHGLAVIGWDECPDLAHIDNREKLSDQIQQSYPDKGKMTIANYVGQVWAFLGRIEKGDLIVLPLKTRSMIAIGKCAGPYKYEPANPAGSRHTRSVEWVRENIPREAFGKDLLYSFGAFMTVCQIKRNNAEERIRVVLSGKEDPLVPTVGKAPEEPEDILSVPDLEQYAADQIRQYIARKFKGHELSHVVAQVLRAEGYQMEVSAPGPDGGVDILAGKGPMGFDMPRLCVQVKSTNAPVEPKVMRELRGVMEDRGADQGLLVSWSGFTRPAVEEARRQFFRVRLWDAGTLVGKILDNYEKLSEELRAELPLKRIWALVLEEE